MKKVVLFTLLFFVPIALADFNETDAIEQPVTFISGMLTGLMSFLSSTIGWFALLFFAVGFAVLIIGVSKSVKGW